MKSFLEQINETSRDKLREIGRELGYPKCCVNHFTHRFQEFHRTHKVTKEIGPWTGTGFIPCPKHQHEILRGGWDEFVGRINSQRNPEFPAFPDSKKVMINTIWDDPNISRKRSWKLNEQTQKQLDMYREDMKNAPDARKYGFRNGKFASKKHMEKWIKDKTKFHMDRYIHHENEMGKALDNDDFEAFNNHRYVMSIHNKDIRDAIQWKHKPHDFWIKVVKEDWAGYSNGEIRKDEKPKEPDKKKTTTVVKTKEKIVNETSSEKLKRYLAATKSDQAERESNWNSHLNRSLKKMEKLVILNQKYGNEFPPHIRPQVAKIRKELTSRHGLILSLIRKIEKRDDYIKKAKKILKRRGET